MKGITDEEIINGCNCCQLCNRKSVYLVATFCCGKSANCSNENKMDYRSNSYNFRKHL